MIQAKTLLKLNNYLNLKVIVSVNILIIYSLLEPANLIEDDYVNPSLDDVEIIRVKDSENGSQGGFSLGNESVIIRRVDSFRSGNNAQKEKSGGGSSEQLLVKEKIERPARDRGGGEYEQNV